VPVLQAFGGTLQRVRGGSTSGRRKEVRMMERKKRKKSNPLRVHIRVSNATQLIGGVIPEEKQRRNLETALQMVEEVKKRHPNAEISVEVEA